MSEQMTRRNFLQAAGIAGAAAIAAPAVAHAGEAADDSGEADVLIQAYATTTAEMKANYDTTYDPNQTPVAQEFVKPAVKLADVEADETVEGDYLVIGAGNCGMLSAARASELGLKVVLLEAESAVGGSAYGTEAHFALDNCEYVKSQGMKTWTVKEAADYFNLYNEFHSSQTLVMSFLNHCGEPFDWWIGKGATVNQLLSSLAGENTSAGFFFDGEAASLAEIDKQVMEENGVDIHTGAKATNLVVDEDGAVTGALAETEGGVLFAKAPYTFVGTGGFGNNPDMVNAYMGARGNSAIVGDTVLYHNGDGLNMMLGAGGITGVLDTVSVGGIQVPDETSGGSITRAASEPFLWVNKYGQRVGCEYWTNPTYGYALISRSPEYFIYTIFDQSLVERMQTEDFFCQSKALPYTYDPVPDMGEQIDAAVERGTVLKADTIEELADKAGIALDAFKATMDEYNAACEAGEDTVFQKDPSMLLPIKTGPFYAVKLVCNRLSSLNGCMINADCQVIDKDGNWIHGLFAGGLDSAGFFAGDYNHAFSGSCSSFSFFTGWRAAETVAKLAGKM